MKTLKTSFRSQPCKHGQNMTKYLMAYKSYKEFEECYKMGIQAPTRSRLKLLQICTYLKRIFC